jgi:hypothetical protein
MGALPPGYKLPPIQRQQSRAEIEREAGERARRGATAALIAGFASPEWHRRLARNRPDVIEMFVAGRMPGIDYREPYVQLALAVAKAGPI